MFAVVVFSKHLHFGVFTRVTRDIIYVFRFVKEIIYAVSLILAAMLTNSVFVGVFGFFGSNNISVGVDSPFAAAFKVALIINSARKNVVFRTRSAVYVAHRFLRIDENIRASRYLVADSYKLLSVLGIRVKIEVFTDYNRFQRETIKEVVIRRNFSVGSVDLPERHIAYTRHRNVFEVRTQLEYAAVERRNAFGKNYFPYALISPERAVLNERDGFKTVDTVVVFGKYFDFGLIYSSVIADVIAIVRRVVNVFNALIV